MAVFTKTGGTNGGSYAKYYTGRLTVWEKSYSITGNYSIVGRRIELISGSSGRFSNYTIGWSVNVDGQANSGSANQSLMTYNTALVLYEDEITVPHNADGTKSVSCSATITSSGTYSPRKF